MINRFGLSMSVKINELSRGMKTKRMLACAFSHNVELLILDEYNTLSIDMNEVLQRLRGI
ncbi:hypothetical protein [Clostridioides sp. ES-S-0108-01]|uniref:hypothetical protein n=1 Tax=Clostridioides sp. ES-S-0108-01 TaxID=2770773 RepID=UPI001D0C8433|nr:hypothetical protein JJC16_13975 [Clostridioides sp. ES-S-0107-01]